ncbi:MAG TPA: hypothetical protein VGO61_14470 [Steroidobacteraceae bacterium]|jgi:hypothetical protein|nr:hypothetical protein [Steroidobacteraceae bacterium]
MQTNETDKPASQFLLLGKMCNTPEVEHEYRETMAELELRLQELLAFIFHARLYQGVLPTGAQAEIAGAVHHLTVEICHGNHLKALGLTIQQLEEMLSPVSLHLSYGEDKQ